LNFCFLQLAGFCSEAVLSLIYFVQATPTLVAVEGRLFLRFPLMGMAGNLGMQCEGYRAGQAAPGTGYA
jgi:hypothetical protein